MELTELQKDAYARIQFYERELEKHGLKVRLAIEQEFLLLSGMHSYDHKNRIDMVRSGVLNHGLKINARGKYCDFDNVLSVLQPKFPALHEMEREFAGEANGKKAPLPIYEAKFDGSNSCKYRASEIAMQVYRFRHEAARHLARNPQLMDVWYDFKGHTLEMVTNSLPLQSHRQLRELSTHFDHTQPIGMHISASVYDKNGKCLSDNYGFYRAQSERLLSLQYKAGLGFIQNKDGLKRLGINKTTPRVVGLGVGEGAKHSGYTLLERQRPYKTTTIAPLDEAEVSQMQQRIAEAQNANTNNMTERELVARLFSSFLRPPPQENTPPAEGTYYPDRYLENRMMGADADPFVATALELASIYDMVQRYPELSGHSPITMEHVNNVWNYHMGDIKHNLDHRIENDLQTWVKRFKTHTELQSLLGQPLYNGILKEYGQTARR